MGLPAAASVRRAEADNLDQVMHGESYADLDAESQSFDTAAMQRAESRARILGGSPSIVPEETGTTYKAGENPFPITDGDADTFAARRARRRARRADFARKLKWPFAMMPTVGMCLAITLVALVLARKDVVRLLPQTAPLYSAMGLHVNLRGLIFDNIKTVREIQDGVPVLIVEGVVKNITSKTVEVSAIRFGLRNIHNQEIYSWIAASERASAKPGESVPFRSRVASPPAESRDVSMRFVNERDMLSTKKPAT